MERQPRLSGIASGLFSAGLYLVIFGLGLGVPLMLLPSLSLFMLGLWLGPVPLLYAAGAGIFLVLIATGTGSAVFYLGFIVLPVLLFCASALTRKEEEWMPAGNVLIDLSVYVALVFAAVIAHFAGQGSVQAQIAQQLRQEFSGADPQVLAAIGLIGDRLSFLLLSASAWWWILLLYAHALIARWILASQGKPVRPSLALEIFSPPLWLPGALTLAGLLSLSDGNWAFMARTLLLILLLPYFLLGTAVIHGRVRDWPNRGIALFLLYFFILSLVWPALIVAGLGVWQQCRSLGRRVP